MLGWECTGPALPGLTHCPRRDKCLLLGELSPEGGCRQGAPGWDWTQLGPVGKVIFELKLEGHRHNWGGPGGQRAERGLRSGPEINSSTHKAATFIHFLLLFRFVFGINCGKVS